jgi:putative membrane protein
MMKESANRRASVRLLALCLGTSAALITPSAALGADLATGGTVRATIGANGAVTSVKQVGSDGATSAFSGQLPVKMSITHTGQSFTYHVENTFTKTQTVHFTDTAGNDRHTTVALQLPLVAQLGVDVPASMKNVTATGATVTTGANGVRHVLWNMVLFSPLGSSAQDVSFTASGSGTPVAELRATPVDPSTAPGLSAKTQDKTAEFQQEDFWAGYASGGNDGLNKLSAGMGQLIDGLSQLLSGAAQLHSGLADGLSGTQQAADGSTKLYNGSKQVHEGQGQLTTGLRKIHNGQGDLTDGLRQVKAGQASLTAGLVQINGGQSSLTDGLTQISGGLAQLNDPTTGLPAALDGIQQLIDGVGSDATAGTLLNGVAQLQGGIGDAATAGTLLNGVAQVQGGLTLLQTGIQQNAGCAVDILNKIIGGFAGGADACATGGLLPPMPAVALSPTSSAVMNGLLAQFTAVSNGTDATLSGAFAQLQGGMTAIQGGLAAMKVGLSTGDFSNPGLKEGLQLTLGGLQQLQTGVGAAVTGIGQLAPGAASALSGSQQLLDGSAQALDGSRQLQDGDAQTLSGSKQLYTGSGQALAGSTKLFNGTGFGALELTGGLKALSDGLVAGAKSFPAAVDGAGQIADGLGQVVPGATQVKDGIGQVQTGATGPLATQLTQASRNAHQQIAVLNAASGLAAQAPGGAGTSYVLAQPGSIALAGNTTASKSSSHTGRNAALIAGGGVLALAIGLGAGMALGRQRVSA